MINKDILDALKTIAKADKQYSQRDYLAVMSKLSTVKEDPYWPSKQELISYFNKAISPYGYPNYQKICHKAAVIVGTAHFCFETLNKVMPDESTGKVLVKSISFDQKMLTAPVLYITDSLGEALFQTKAPDSVEVSKKFYNEFLVVFSNQFKKINWVWIRFNEESSRLEYNFSYNYKGIEILWEDNHEFAGEEIDADSAALQWKYNYQRINWLCCGLINESNKSDPQIWDELKDEANKCKDIAVELTKDVDSFVCNLILLSQQQPEILTVQDSGSKYADADSKGFKATRMNRQPQVHWLGENFTTRTVHTNKGEAERQVGSPKRSHWRKGHWHTVLQGPGRKQKQMRWFQPTFIRGNA
jgi:hypothetical protein